MRQCSLALPLLVTWLALDPCALRGHQKAAHATPMVPSGWDDLAEDRRWLQIRTWSWPPPRNGFLDSRSLSLLHLAESGAPLPIHLQEFQQAVAARLVGRYAPSRAMASLRLATRAVGAATRAQAATALGWAKDPGAEPFVSSLLHDSNPSVRARAAEALGLLDDPEAVGPLERALLDERDEVRAAAGISLGRLGNDKSLTLLQAAARSGGPASRRAAWEAIALLGGQRSVSSLRHALGDVSIRLDAAGRIDEVSIDRIARASGRGANAAGLVQLAGDLTDPDPVLRAGAVVALGEARNPLSTEALMGALVDSDERVRGLAAQALGHLGNPRAIGPLAAALMRSDAWLGGMDQAGPALLRIGDPSVLPHLAQSLYSPNPRAAAASLLVIGKLGGRSDVPAIGAALSRPDALVRSAAAVAAKHLAALPEARDAMVSCGRLGRYGILTDVDMRLALPTVGPSPGCVSEGLIRLLRDPSPEVRISAAQGLAKLGDNRAYGELYFAASDPDPVVAVAARLALKAGGDPIGRAMGAIPSQLIANLKVADRGARISAALALCAFPSTRAASALLEIGRKANPLTAVWLAAAAMRLHGNRSTSGFTQAMPRPAWEILASAAASPDPVLRREAMEATAWLRLPQTVALSSAALRDDDWEVRTAAARSLALSSDVQTSWALRSLVEHGAWREAVTALDAIESGQRVPQAVLNLARHHRDLRVRWAAERLNWRLLRQRSQDFASRPATSSASIRGSRLCENGQCRPHISVATPPEGLWVRGP